MSVPVELADLPARIGEFDAAYVLSVRDDLRPHVVSARPEWDGVDLVVSAGRTTATNAAARPAVTLCYWPADAGGFSLLVDGRASVTGDIVRVTPTSAVLHRPPPEA